MRDQTNLRMSYKDDKPQTNEVRCFTCNQCGEKFDSPLAASVFSQNHIQTYRACPRCLGKIPENEERGTDRYEASASDGGEKKQAELEGQNCQYYFGYLKKRPKETAIPEVCLTCERIIECMVAN